MTTDVFANLSGKTAVVTGSSTGIGRAIALEFAAAGATLIVHYNRSQNAAEDTVDLIQEKTGQTPVVVQWDLSDQSRWDAFVDHCRSEISEVDTWVNNAGVDLLTGDARELTAHQKLQKLLEVDVSATVQLSRIVGQKMKSRGSGSILNIGWDQADRGMEGDSGELFATAKNAIMGFTRSLAVSLAPAVRVNCIAPGWIKTAWGEQASENWQQRVLDETPLKRWGTPEDIARTARFLASDEASFITGQVINVNGGAVR